MKITQYIKKYLYTNYPKKYGAMKYTYALLSLPFRLFFLKLGLTVFFSGKEQDKWVIDTTAGEKNLYFVDLAATSGII